MLILFRWFFFAKQINEVQKDFYWTRLEKEWNPIIEKTMKSSLKILEIQADFWKKNFPCSFLGGGFFTNPIEKICYARQIGANFLNFSGWKFKKYVFVATT